jgi:hypothetical protein
MANINTESKGPKGVNIEESLIPSGSSGYARGLAVTYGTDPYHALLNTTPASACVGLIAEDAVATTEAISVIEFGQTVAQVGGAVTALQPLTNNAAGQLVPATAGQPVIAVALEGTSTAGDYICVFVVGLGAFALPASDAVTHLTGAGAIPVVGGTYGIGSAAALAMTLLPPAAANAQDGTRLFIVAETAHAHTISVKTAGGVKVANSINGAGDTVTFAAIGDGVELEAVGGIWVVRSLVGGAAVSEV